jgi:predicted  nucleic acid-binding Zn-ribbon protein
MPGPAVILREVHRLRRHAKDLQDRIEQAPRQLRSQQGKVAYAEEKQKEGQETIKRLKVTTHELDVSLKALRQQIKKYEQQLNESTSKKEYDSLQAEIKAARQKDEKTENDILDAMLQTEEQTARLPEFEKAVKQAKADLAELDGELQTRVAQLEAQRQEALAQITAVEATLPPGDVRAQYERLIKALGEDAMSLVENRTCMACYTEITSQQSHNLLLEQFVLCKNCGRALYLPE